MNRHRPVSATYTKGHAESASNSGPGGFRSGRRLRPLLPGIGPAEPAGSGIIDGQYQEFAAALTGATWQPLALALPAAAGPGTPRQRRCPLVKAYNQSGLELFKIFAGQPGNIVFSPYSIGTAMAMVLSGARGETQADMLKALRHGAAGEPDRRGQCHRRWRPCLPMAGQAAKCPDGFKLNGKQCEAAGARRSTDAALCRAAPCARTILCVDRE